MVQPNAFQTAATPGESAELRIAVDSFICEVDGHTYSFVAGETIVAADHEAVTTHPQLFRPYQKANPKRVA